MADVSAAMTLPDYLASLRQRRWRPGILDCGVFMADWVIQLCGRDPIMDVRGTYSTEKHFQRILRDEGGLQAACAARLGAIGFRKTSVATAGDVMAVLAPYAIHLGAIQRMPTGAICVSETMRAVVTSDLGVVIADEIALPTLSAWTVNA